MICARAVGFIPDLKGRGILLDRRIKTTGRNLVVDQCRR